MGAERDGRRGRADHIGWGKGWNYLEGLEERSQVIWLSLKRVMLAAMWKTDRGGAWEVARAEAQRQVRKAVDVARCPRATLFWKLNIVKLMYRLGNPNYTLWNISSKKTLMSYRGIHAQISLENAVLNQVNVSLVQNCRGFHLLMYMISLWGAKSRGRGCSMWHRPRQLEQRFICPRSKAPFS